MRTHVAFGLALIAVLTWSSSPALIKIALRELGPLEIAGLRYFGAFLVLSPILVARSRASLRRLKGKDWVRLFIMGLLAYPLANGIFFWALQYIPSTTLSFLLNAVPIVTLGLGALSLGERPTRIQWVGVVVALVGAGMFFDGELSLDDRLPVVATLAGVLAVAVFGVMSRDFAAHGRLDSIGLSALPAFFGGLALLLVAPPLRRPISLSTWAILAWLAVVNSAIAYLLWNRALQHLQAFEISLVGNLMPIGTALLAPILLGEEVLAGTWMAMIVALIGVVLVGAGRSGSRIFARARSPAAGP